ncbi:MAG TPA: hypothetical protein VER96_30790 [Polyangiaceae bacterium]|nr:hypothetical protein [Polyangiaceae bacterium]
MSIEELSLSVPVQQRAQFICRAELAAQRAREKRASELELELSLRVLSVLHGAAALAARGREP